MNPLNPDLKRKKGSRKQLQQVHAVQILLTDQEIQNLQLLHHRVFISESLLLIIMHSCQPSRFHRESPEIFSISRLPPGLHICNSISRDCYLSLHTCIDKTPSFGKALVSACSKVQLEACHYNTSCERVHVLT